MKIGTFEIRLMSKGNDSLWFWYDIYFRGRWHVISWRKGSRPYCYSSTDGTPPCSDNRGKWFFGRKTYDF